MKWGTLVKIAKITRAVFVILTIAITVLFALFLEKEGLDIAVYFMVIPLAVPFVVMFFVVIYKIIFNEVLAMDKKLKKNKLEYITEDINLLKRDYPWSGISLGKYAFYVAGMNEIVPYHQIAWVYQKKTSIQIIFRWKSVVIHDYDGNIHEYSIRFKDVLKIVYGLREYYPNILIGYGEQEQKAYYSMLERRYKTRTTQKSLENAIGKGK